MRRSVLLFSALAMACGGSSSSNKPSRKLVILHTNDEHSHLVGYGPEVDDFPTAAAAGSGITGGAARRMVILKAERDAATAGGADSLTVSAGDNMMGTVKFMLPNELAWGQVSGSSPARARPAPRGGGRGQPRGSCRATCHG